MKLCPKCTQSIWPFAIVLAISGVVGFVTWLVLGLAVREDLPRAAGAAVVFLAVGATLVHYVLDCLKRHCPHNRKGHHPHRHRIAHHGG
jgi:uncharacterized membrane protein